MVRHKMDNSVSSVAIFWCHVIVELSQNMPFALHKPVHCDAIFKALVSLLGTLIICFLVGMGYEGCLSIDY